jgi:hypothetical protein
MKAEDSRQVDASEAASARNVEGVAHGAEALTRTRERTNAGWDGLMEAVCERGNCQRVVENKGAAAVDGITVAEFKDHLKRYWPVIEAKLLAGSYVLMLAGGEANHAS